MPTKPKVYEYNTQTMDLPDDVRLKLEAYERIRETQRKNSKAYIAKISNTDDYRKKQRDYYYANQDKKQEQGRKNWSTYYNRTGKEQKQKYYDRNREIINFKQSYRYYMKHKTIDDFKMKFKDRYDKLVEVGFIVP
eukprot:COSAG01_NODE_2206_length_8170_cov_70.537108_3_plen_136_part_00